MSEVSKLLNKEVKPKDNLVKDKSALFVHPDIHKEFKKFCAVRGVTMREMTEALLADVMNGDIK